MTDMTMLSVNQEIEALIPHRPPMQLLDSVIAAGPARLLASAELTPQAPFQTALGVPACVGIEYLGQAAAAFFSVSRGATTVNQPPRPGMLIASRSYRCNDGHFPTSHHLLIDIVPSSVINSSGLVKFRGEIYVCHQDQVHAKPIGALCEFLTAAQSFAEGDLSVYLPPPELTPESNPL